MLSFMSLWKHTCKRENVTFIAKFSNLQIFDKKSKLPSLIKEFSFAKKYWQIHVAGFH